MGAELTGTWSAPDRAAVDTVIDDLLARDAVNRMWSGDHTLWQDDPTECADRLGWLHVIDEVPAAVAELESLAEECAADGLTDAVVLGMGGSSLFPELLAKAFPARPGRLRVHVLDTTDPAAIRRVDDRCPLDTTLFVAASKSGSTIETSSQLAHEWSRYTGRADAGSHFVAITDPGSALGALGRERGFRQVVENRSDIGGRFSALSFFGLVPGALLGVDLRELLAQASAMAERCRASDRSNPGLVLGAAMAAASARGRDKLTVLTDPSVPTFGAWLEQLVAESTGKHGRGVLPVVDEPDEFAAARMGDRLMAGWSGTATLPTDQPGVWLAEPGGLGGLVFVWEVATALCGAAMGLNPFDQPDVAAAKSATSAVLAGGLPDIPLTPVADILAEVGAGDYVALCAFVDPGSALVDHLQEARLRIGRRLGVATTLGLGPRFLHSTGQLHKGGAPNGVFIQVVGDDPDDIDIPGQPFSFSTLKWAQAAGDLQVLGDRARRVARVALSDLLDV